MKTLKKFTVIAAALAVLFAFASCSNNSDDGGKTGGAGGDNTTAGADGGNTTPGSDGDNTEETGPMLKSGVNINMISDGYTNHFQSVISATGAGFYTLEKIVFGLLSDNEVKTAIEDEIVALTKQDIGTENDVYYAYYDAANKTVYIVPADEDIEKFVLNPESGCLFDGMSICSSIEGLNLLDTSNVTDMGGMFNSCTSLEELDLSSFDTSNVECMESMFSTCGSLTSLDLSSFKTSNVTDMNYMFQFCGSLTSLDLSSFKTSNVTDMRNMFQSCDSLTSLDLSSFNTSNVEDMERMFIGCESLTSLDLSRFDTSNVEDMYHIFYECKKLETVYVQDKETFIPENYDEQADSLFIRTSEPNGYGSKIYVKDVLKNIADKQ